MLRHSIIRLNIVAEVSISTQSPRLGSRRTYHCSSNHWSVRVYDSNIYIWNRWQTNSLCVMPSSSDRRIRERSTTILSITVRNGITITAIRESKFHIKFMVNISGKFDRSNRQMCDVWKIISRGHHKKRDSNTQNTTINRQRDIKVSQNKIHIVT